METERLTVNREEARELYHKYLSHKHYAQPIDLEIQRIYDAIQKGKVVIQALASIAAAGLGKDGLPKLAIVCADAETCSLYLKGDGSARFSDRSYRPDHHRRRYIDMPPGTFAATQARTYRNWEAQVPLVPIYLRPKRGLANYHILFEAEWRPVPPKDPMLLRRIGRGDLWLCVAQWNLTPVEMAVLAERL